MDLLELASRASADLETSNTSRYLISSECTYHHYLCDGFDDRGWGCGYRSLQSMCSWVIASRLKLKTKQHSEEVTVDPHIQQEVTSLGCGATSLGVCVPSLRQVQEILVETRDKPAPFIGSREWIGCFEACLVLDCIYGVSCKIVHVTTGKAVVDHVTTLASHFQTIGSPVMIGGDVDGASKTLLGVAVEEDRHTETKFLIADPHYSGTFNIDTVLEQGYAKWHSLDLFQSSSFYNFCLPQNPHSHST